MTGSNLNNAASSRVSRRIIASCGIGDLQKAQGGCVGVERGQSSSSRCAIAGGQFDPAQGEAGLELLLPVIPLRRLREQRLEPCFRA